MAVCEVFRTSFPHEKNIHDWQFPLGCFLGDDRRSGVVNLPDPNSLNVDFCAVGENLWVSRNRDSLLESVAGGGLEPSRPVVLVAVVGGEADFYRLGLRWDKKLLIGFEVSSRRGKNQQAGDARPYH